MSVEPASDNYVALKAQVAAYPQIHPVNAALWGEHVDELSVVKGGALIHERCFMQLAR